MTTLDRGVDVLIAVGAAGDHRNMRKRRLLQAIVVLITDGTELLCRACINSAPR